ncbi:SpaH/EbpB family LPXTG-anchored major pilin [Bifidobacterium eulemuris]|uniref:Fimbrial protein n=1 Tax=Bifidobacterium eulemuris TaxID=1765219 RepID=A0A261GDR8_9BIFI|nr:SpaH/EbpB family LPXTG-anchored major pilin [Bifidobacterium eulemuris]OZG69581.1 fimbrial protein [Bifidobacterium eulemuris]QOL32124.1 SpaH/EbpB family LPXTG-anchored major pilin [Bifidobacterium eulemuris]
MKMRKLFAGIAAAATMLAGLALGAATASADEGAVVKRSVEFTFTADDAAQLTDRSITVYKIGDYVAYGTDQNVAYGVKTSGGVKNDAVRSALTSAGVENIPENVDALTWAMGTDGTLDQSATRPWNNPSVTRAFANALAAGAATNLTAVNPTPTFTVDETAKTMTVRLPAGVYLFVDNTVDNAASAVTKAVPMLVAAGTTTNGVLNPFATGEGVNTVNFKNTKNTSKTKTVEETSASIGDTLHYTLTGTIANPAPTEFKFTDKPGTGLTINSNSFEFYTVTTDDEGDEIETEVTDATKFTVPDTDVTGGDKVSFEVVVNDPTEFAGQTIRVKFTATVNDDADTTDGVVNKLDNYGKTVEAKTQLHGFNFQKINADKAGVNGATFKVYEGTTVGDQSVAIKFLGSNGSYKKAANQNNETATDELKTATVESTAGKLVVKGLKAGTYTVVETKVASGYQDFKASFTVTINDKGGVTFAKAEDAFGLVTLSDDSHSVTVLNIKSITQLPLTGAAGTALFSAIALLLVGAAFTVYAKSRNTKRALNA